MAVERTSAGEGLVGSNRCVTGCCPACAPSRTCTRSSTSTSVRLVTLSEWGEVIGGGTFRLVQASGAPHRTRARALIRVLGSVPPLPASWPVQASDAPLLVLEVLLLAVEQRQGVCGRGFGTRLVNYFKSVALRIAHRRGLSAAILTQSDWQAGPGGGAARQFWARQRLRATPQAMLLTRALFEWDATNEVGLAFAFAIALVFALVIAFAFAFALRLRPSPSPSASASPLASPSLASPFHPYLHPRPPPGVRASRTDARVDLSVAAARPLLLRVPRVGARAAARRRRQAAARALPPHAAHAPRQRQAARRPLLTAANRERHPDVWCEEAEHTNGDFGLVLERSARPRAQAAEPDAALPNRRRSSARGGGR